MRSSPVGQGLKPSIPEVVQLPNVQPECNYLGQQHRPSVLLVMARVEGLAGFPLGRCPNDMVRKSVAWLTIRQKLLWVFHALVLHGFFPHLLSKYGSLGLARAWKQDVCVHAGETS